MAWPSVIEDGAVAENEANRETNYREDRSKTFMIPPASARISEADEIQRINQASRKQRIPAVQREGLDSLLFQTRTPEPGSC